MGRRGSGRRIFLWPRYPVDEKAIGILSFLADMWPCALVDFLEMAFVSSGFIADERKEGICEGFHLCRSSLFSSLDVF